MLTPEYMRKLPKEIIGYYQDLEDKILLDVIRRLEGAGGTTATAEHQVSVMLNLGYNTRDIERLIENHTNISKKKINELIEKSARISYTNDEYLYAIGRKTLKKYAQNEAVNRLVVAAQRFSENDLTNITKTMGLNGMPLQDYYRETLSKATIGIQSGAFSHTEILRKTIRELGEKGLQTISYDSGSVSSIEAAVRRNLLTTINNLSGEMSMMNARDMSQDLMELTAHMGARPSHADWQGQIVSLSGNPKYLSLTDIGYGDAGGFMGVNCRHNWYPFFENISERAWSDKDLRNIDPEPFKYDGREYTYYEATQRQRALERNIRKAKKKAMLFEEVGDREMSQQERIKIKRYHAEYKRFSEAARISQKNERKFVAK